MPQILLLNKIAKIGLEHLPESYQCGEDVSEPNGVLVRSAAMHDMELPQSLLAIARAGAGTNNIPIAKCTQQGIVVFNTPGANANAVKEIVIAGLLLSSRKIIPAVKWSSTLKGEGDNVTKLVEKGKSQFAGPEIEGKTLGVIGLGAIGILVANAAATLGMNVIGYDPYLSVDAAWGMSRAVKHAKSLDQIFEESDYITIHVPLNNETRDTISQESIAKMKDGVRILNFARGELVNTEDILQATACGKVSCYVTDFPNEALLEQENIITIPHLGASTPESEDNCAVMAVKELRDYLENGNLTNSVNFPNVSAPRTTPVRICILHQNIPNMIGQITKIFADLHINIDNFVNKSKGENAYSMLDIESENVTDQTVFALRQIEGVFRIRVIK